MSAVGIPIGGGLGMAFFLWLVLRQILQSQIDEIETLTMFCESLENRARTMSNDMTGENEITFKYKKIKGFSLIEKMIVKNAITTMVFEYKDYSVSTEGVKTESSKSLIDKYSRNHRNNPK